MPTTLRLLFIRVLSILPVFASGLTAGCASVPPIVAPMRETTTPSLEAPPDRARVLLVRPSVTYGSDVLVQVDHADPAKAAEVATLVLLANKSVAVVDVPPGLHHFCASTLLSSTFVPGVGVAPGVFSAGGQYAGLLTEATLEAGKTYLLKVDIVSHLLTPGTADLLAVPARSREWADLVESFPELRAVERAEPLPPPIPTVLATCMLEREQATPEERAERTLRTEDGSARGR
jgi:hypothetical protein